MNEITTALPTHQEAKSALDSLLVAFSDSAPLDEALIKTATLGIAKGVQIRDYSLGGIGLALTDPYDSLTFIASLEVLGEVSPALLALESAYAYEAGENARALRVLDKALELDPAHSLSALLKRVYGSNWPVEAFQSMRNELHPKVEAGLIPLESVIVGQE